uniref:Putative fad binding domain-containing protein n=1 Tax=Diffractella curvata TaxID=2819868 RepID=A0A7R6QM14_9PEZI|nr:putative fad binding domain-containing protein [Diffractella curvata]
MTRIPPFSIGVIATIMFCFVYESNCANVTNTCAVIGRDISSASAIIYPSDTIAFTTDTSHFTESSNQIPTCVLEVGSAQDVAVALKIIGATKTPFAIMSGGHSSNQKFSSTTGIHISLIRLRQVVFSADKSTVEIGMGINGTITTASKRINPDLFFALKGGLNRFGIVTSAVFETHAQVPLIYGGQVFYSTDDIPAVINATLEFYKLADIKTQIMYIIATTPTQESVILLAFHDGPNRPSSLSVFDNITPLSSTLSTLSFSDFVHSIQDKPRIRGTADTISTTGITTGFIKAVSDQIAALREAAVSHGAASIAFDIEPFTDYGKHATDSAYPHTRSQLPLGLDFSWVSADDDEFWHDTAKNAIAKLKVVAAQEGIYNPKEAAYPNYSAASKTALQLYGEENTERLKRIRAQIDPYNVMKLAGGFDL